MSSRRLAHWVDPRKIERIPADPESLTLVLEELACAKSDQDERNFSGNVIAKKTLN